jgi:hypothetical protein
MKVLRAHDYKAASENAAITSLREAVRELRECINDLREGKREHDDRQLTLFDDEEWEYHGGA